MYLTMIIGGNASNNHFKCLVIKREIDYCLSVSAMTATATDCETVLH